MQALKLIHQLQKKRVDDSLFGKNKLEPLSETADIPAFNYLCNHTVTT